MKLNSLTIAVLIIFTILFVDCKKNNSGRLSVPDLAGSGYMPEVKGVKLTYTNSDGSTQITTVTDVRDSAGYKVSSLLNEIPGFGIFVSLSMYNEKHTFIYQYPTPVYYQSLQLIALQPGVKGLSHKESPFVITVLHKDPVGSVACNETQFAEYHYFIGDDPPLEIDFTGTNHKGITDSTESINVHGGKFDCIRVRFSNTTVFKGVPMAPVTTDITCWVALKTGLVKTVSISSNGDINTLELTKVERE